MAVMDAVNSQAFMISPHAILCRRMDSATKEGVIFGLTDDGKNAKLMLQKPEFKEGKPWAMNCIKKPALW